jgi:hypothetical protein
VTTTTATDDLARANRPRPRFPGGRALPMPRPIPRSGVADSRYADGRVSVLPRTRRRRICNSRNPSSPSVTAGQPPRVKPRRSCTRQDGLDRTRPSPGPAAVGFRGGVWTGHAAVAATDSNGDSNVGGQSPPLTHDSSRPRLDLITRPGSPLRLISGRSFDSAVPPGT